MFFLWGHCIIALPVCYWLNALPINFASMPALIVTTGNHRWAFSSEAALEDWLWLNLESLLHLKPLRRQYFVRGQYCDILAVGQEGQLYILELKNAEDRYIVQQMTRYYDALLAETPFHDEIDYQKPPQLIAIAPRFHPDTITDLKYHTLKIQLCSFKLHDNLSRLEFHLSNSDRQVILKAEIPYPEAITDGHQVPEPPRFLLNLLSDLPPDHQQSYLQMRDRLLSFDRRMQEIKYGAGVRYGRGASKLCAQIQLTKSLQHKQMNCYLWLPSLNTYQKRKQILRINIGGYPCFANHDFYLIHCPDKTRRTGQSWKLSSAIELAKQLNDTFILGEYRKLIENDDPSKNFKILLEIALDNWLEKHG
jgi:RecB family endonuclease NucS